MRRALHECNIGVLHPLPSKTLYCLVTACTNRKTTREFQYREIPNSYTQPPPPPPPPPGNSDATEAANRSVDTLLQGMRAHNMRKEIVVGGGETVSMSILTSNREHYQEFRRFGKGDGESDVEEDTDGEKQSQTESRFRITPRPRRRRMTSAAGDRRGKKELWQEKKF